MDKIAIVGLGAMGRPMALNLIAKGFEVTGFDASAKAVLAFEREGGHAAASCAEAARDASALLMMVVNAKQAEAALFDEGAAAVLAPGAVVILGITCAPLDAVRIAGRLDEMGLEMLDAPVSGGTIGAKAGSLTVMAAGPAATLARVRPVLDAVGSRIFHVGASPGQGSSVKAINQLLCGVHIAAAAEAMHLVERAGLEPALMLEIFGQSAAASWMLNTRGPRMFEAEPEVTSAVDIFVKDLDIVLDFGAAVKTPLLLAAAARQLYLSASSLGFGGADDSQVVQALRAMTGASLAPALERTGP